MPDRFLNDITPDSSIVVLTGSGISAESGIETFRDEGGIWSRYSIEDVATPEAFARNPLLVHDFYNQRRAGLLNPDLQPNPAHDALARLEQEWPGAVLLVTQNVDDLHERAGSRSLRHMHGELLKSLCAHCGDTQDCTNDLSVDTVCSACRQPGGLRPDVVWFGEMPRFMDEIAAVLSQCGLFISIGTSGNVYPASGFVHQALVSGAKTMEINLEPSANARDFHTGLYGPAGREVPAFVEKILGKV